MYINIFLTFCISLFAFSDKLDNDPPIGEHSDYLSISLMTSSQHQTIHNFGASDAWSCQFVGKNWPIEKKNKIADLLFSKNTDAEGSPLGIGLNSWRFNIGAGSAEQGNQSNISDEWRRAEGFLNEDGTYDWAKQEGQRWFLRAAKERGVNTFIAFVNSPPVVLTKNGRAYGGGGNSTNLASDKVDEFTAFLCEVVQYLEESEGIDIKYLSPVNEPQWDWDNPSQEGSPWLNSEIANVVRKLDKQIKEKNLNVLIELPEAGQIDYLYETNNRPGRGDQVDEFFKTSSSNYVGNLESVARKVAGHSYYSTWDVNRLLATRNSLNNKINSYNNLEYWMTEYTLLEDNDEVKGKGRDLGMGPALYMARVLHADLTLANASAWQWWLAISPYNYKDGLVYIDYNKSNGNIQSSKLLWVLGNYSRFIQSGMKRIDVKRSDLRAIEQTLGGVMVSSFIDPQSGKTVSVAINYGQNTIPVKIDIDGNFINCSIYQTSSLHDLKKLGQTDFQKSVDLSPRSVTTFVEL